MVTTDALMRFYQHLRGKNDLLGLLGDSGIVLNPSKFQFCEKTVDFAGFRISANEVASLPKYIATIKNFPTPSSITDIRSWFGLVNQVAHYAQLSTTMEPFKKFLSPKNQFMWTSELQDAFECSKNAIVDAIRQGVQIFDKIMKTCLTTDFSNTGIGHYLSQKHCDCESSHPGCCDQG